jgi:arsenate reductase
MNGYDPSRRLAHPISVNRPIVDTLTAMWLCRPSHAVPSLLARPPRAFVKEDGEKAVRETGQA